MSLVCWMLTQVSAKLVAMLPPDEKHCIWAVCNKLLHVSKDMGFDSSGKAFFPFPGPTRATQGSALGSIRIRIGSTNFFNEMIRRVVLPLLELTGLPLVEKIGALLDAITGFVENDFGQKQNRC